MYCIKCGMKNDDNAYRCTRCSEILQPIYLKNPMRQHVPNYLIMAILVTFLFWPLGIPAIYFAAQVDRNLLSGDYPGAIYSSNLAKTLSWIALGVGLFNVFCLFIFLIVYVLPKIM
jgi:hypothetical protein